MLAKKPKGATEKRSSSSSTGLLWMFVGAILTLMIGLFMYLWNPFDVGSEQKVEEREVQPISQPESESGNDYEFYDLLPEQEITSIPEGAIVSVETGDGSNIQSDVVLTRPTTQDREEARSEEATSENSSSQSQRVTAARGEQEIVIVEEEGTYDSGSSNSSSSNADSASSSNTNNNNRAAASNSSASIQAATPQRTYILQINSFTNAQDADKRRAQVLMAGVNANVVKNTQNGQVYYQVVSTPMTNRQQVAAALQKLQNNGIDALIVEQRHQ